MLGWAKSKDFDRLSFKIDQFEVKIKAMDTIYNILEKVQEMKNYFDEQIKTFVIKDDFSNTFKKIDDILYQHEHSLYKRQEDWKHFVSEFKEVHFQLNQKSVKLETEEEHK